MLDAKGQPYQLDRPKSAAELAKDVVALANTSGGVIVIGLRTRRKGSSEVIEEVGPVPDKLIDRDRYGSWSASASSRLSGTFRSGGCRSATSADCWSSTCLPRRRRTSRVSVEPLAGDVSQTKEKLAAKIYDASKPYKFSKFRARAYRRRA